MSAMSIALPAADVREDGPPSAHGSRGSDRAAVLSSSSRFVSTTCAAGKHRAEARGESRHTTEDLFEVREGCRFD